MMTKLVAGLALVILLSSTASAQGSVSPREQLKQYVAELNTNPNNDALRERVIRLAVTLDPKPAIPVEARELAGRGKAAMQTAQSSGDYAVASLAFLEASRIAPWEPSYYYNLGIVQEKAGEYGSAIRSFKWYLMAAPDADDADAVFERIGGLKLMEEKAHAARREQDDAAARQLAIRANFDNFRALVQGLRYRHIFCAGPPEWNPPTRQTNAGCNWAQFQGKNWYSGDYFRVAGSTRYVWRFNSEYASLLDAETGYEPLRAKSEGPTLDDIVFESKDPLAPERGWQRVNFVRRNANYFAFTLGWHVPSNDAPMQYPEKRYHYTGYEATN